VAAAKMTLTVANAVPPPATVTPVANPAPPVTSIAGTVIGDTTAPDAPTKLSVVLPRAKIPAAKVRVTLRWVKPTAADLGKVVVVLNLKRAPRNPTDGSKVYSGLGTSVALTMRVGRSGYVARRPRGGRSHSPP
jgi:hypothetical protein